MRVNGRDSANHEKINCPPLNRVEIDRENQICETPGTQQYSSWVTIPIPIPDRGDSSGENPEHHGAPDSRACH